MVTGPALFISTALDKKSNAGCLAIGTVGDIVVRDIDRDITGAWQFAPVQSRGILHFARAFHRHLLDHRSSPSTRSIARAVFLRLSASPQRSPTASSRRGIVAMVKSFI